MGIPNLTISETNQQSNKNQEKGIDFFPQVSFFEHCREPQKPCHKPLSFALESIKNGKWKELADKAKKFTDTEGYQNFKKYSVPVFTVHGTFSYRNNESIIEHNGFACMDLDNLEDVLSIKEKLKRNPYVYCVFLSISGSGLCVFCRIADTNLFNEMHDGCKG